MLKQAVSGVRILGSDMMFATRIDLKPRPSQRTAHAASGLDLDTRCENSAAMPRMLKLELTEVCTPS